MFRVPLRDSKKVYIASRSSVKDSIGATKTTYQNPVMFTVHLIPVKNDNRNTEAGSVIKNSFEFGIDIGYSNSIKIGDGVFVNNEVSGNVPDFVIENITPWDSHLMVTIAEKVL